MNRNIGTMSTVILFSTFILVSACDSGQPAAPPPVQQAPVQFAPPVAPPPMVQPQVAIPTPPPATPLIPVGDAPAATPSTAKKGSGSGSIDKPLSGNATSGDELIGNYSCAIDSKQLSIGPFKAPPFGCKIYRSQDGALKVSSSSEGAGSMKGDIKDQTVTGFFVNGKYDLSGNAMAIKAKMKLSGAGKYTGSGRSRFNDDKSNQIDYKLTMTRK